MYLPKGCVLDIFKVENTIVDLSQTFKFSPYSQLKLLLLGTNYNTYYHTIFKILSVESVG